MYNCLFDKISYLIDYFITFPVNRKTHIASW